MGMPTPLRALIVEDSENDTMLLLDALQHGGFEPSWERVQTAEGLTAALDRQTWDVVIADFTMPGFSGIRALHLLRARDLDVPFIFVSGTIGEDVAVEAMKTGAHDYILKGNLRRLVPAIQRELRDADSRHQHRRMTAHVQHLAYHDLLTDLPNRVLLRDRMHQALAAAQREERPLAFIMLDLDGFKEINDMHGHRAGDLVLQQVSRRTLEALREADTLARLGGDEFGVLLPTADLDAARLVAHRILEAVAQPFHSGGVTLDVKVSIGVAMYPAHGRTEDLLMRRADVAMYSAKESKSGVAVYSSDLDRHSEQRLELSNQLIRAVQKQQLVLHYQPKVDLRDGRVVRLEALSRWPHPTEGLLLPGRFIGLAERTGLIRDLTFAALSIALRDCHAWRAQGLDLCIAVNLSPRSLRDESFPDELYSLILAFGLTPDCLELEITENVIIENPRQAFAILTRLSEMGIRLSIDDFGAGYSSLGYLSKLPVHEIKIDKSLVADLGRLGDEMIVRSTIELAHNLGMTVVAEGVETRAVWEQLRELGCDAAQGFYVCKPLERDAMDTWLRDRRESGGSIGVGILLGYGRDRDRSTDGDEIAGSDHRGVLGSELRSSIQSAIAAFGAIKSGRVGIAGSTGTLLDRSLSTVNDLVDRLLVEPPASRSTPHAKQALIRRH